MNFLRVAAAKKKENDVHLNFQLQLFHLNLSPSPTSLPRLCSARWDKGSFFVIENDGKGRVLYVRFMSKLYIVLRIGVMENRNYE